MANTVSTHEFAVFEFVIESTTSNKNLDYVTLLKQSRIMLEISETDEEYATFFKACWTRLNRLKQSHAKKGLAYIQDQGRKEMK